MPNAHITATQAETGLRRETVTSVSGSFDLPALPVGLYTVVGSATGFRDARFEALRQTVSHTTTLDITLTVAGVTQHVEVSDTAALDQTTAALGATTASEQVRQLPLNGRNWSPLTAHQQRGGAVLAQRESRISAIL